MQWNLLNSCNTVHFAAPDEYEDLYVKELYDYMTQQSSSLDVNNKESELVGEKETRAWTIKEGMTAPQAAGVIHTDFEKGFIRAETVAFNDFVTHKGIPGCKEKGALRLEGKEYVVKEADIMNFRFNV